MQSAIDEISLGIEDLERYIEASKVVLSERKAAVKKQQAIVDEHEKKLKVLMMRRNDLRRLRLFEFTAPEPVTKPENNLLKQLNQINTSADKTEVVNRLIDAFINHQGNKIFSVRDVFNELVNIPNKNFCFSYPIITVYLSSLVKCGLLCITTNGANLYQAVPKS